MWQTKASNFWYTCICKCGIYHPCPIFTPQYSHFCDLLQVTNLCKSIFLCPVIRNGGFYSISALPLKNLVSCYVIEPHMSTGNCSW